MVRGRARIVYLDHAASTPCDARVAAAMAEVLARPLGNPHALHHLPGREAAALVAEARERVARAVGAAPEDVVFTSGATESNNLAIRGAARGIARKTLVTCRTEHLSVLRPCEELAAEGWRVRYIPTDRCGRLDLDGAGERIDTDTELVSVMWVNNELGTVHDIAAVGRLTRARDALLHVDAAQAVGRVAVDMRASAVDLLTLSGHKLYGPPGIGALVVGPRARERGLHALLAGGGQQDGLRPGTINVAGAVGLGVACELALAGDASVALGARIRAWLGALPGAHCLSPPDAVPGLVAAAFEGIDASDLLACLEGVAISAHAACHDDPTRTSHVLAAVGIPTALAAGAVRISVGRSTTRDELDLGLAEIAEQVAFLRTLAKGDSHG
jgi:cysteine desulfurase